ncbi:MAG: SUMF1/EgtB/PvdO family nonheme iron enzyme [Bacteroidota bacterium]
MRYLPFILIWLNCGVMANNLQLSQLRWVGQDKFQVTISWENSWWLTSSPGNHDAVWVFAKYRAANGSWQPIPFSAQSLDHQSWGTALQLEAVPDEMGIFARRASQGSGNIGPETVELTLAQPLPPGSYDLRVFGIEMVYIPEGSFWLGDSSSFHHFRDGASSGPLQISSEAFIPVGLNTGELCDTTTYSPVGTLPPNFPKGYAGFYSMKYEIGQAQYRDFLNCLTFGQQESRTLQPPDADRGTFVFSPTRQLASRNGLAIAVPGIRGQIPAQYGCDASDDGNFNRQEDGQNRACNFLNWQDVTAYLDWAGLRPMTELEFEKICRGPVRPVGGEFAWGTPEVIDANTVQFDGTDGETVSETATSTAGLASHGYTGPTGGLRAGFGGSATSDRLQIGGSYYGVLEMSGNVWELCVSVTSTEGLNYRGTLGDGTLAPNGDADVASWPENTGVGYRGGAFLSGVFALFRDLAVSDRYYAGLFPSLRRNTSGGRGVR